MYYRRDKNRKSTSLHGAFNVIFGNVYFVMVILNNCGRKLQLSESSQKSLSEKFGPFEVNFLNVCIFPRAGVVISCFLFNKEYFNEKMSSLVGLEKSYSFFCKSTDFGHFWLPGSTFKVDFLNVQANFQTIIGYFPGVGC